VDIEDLPNDFTYSGRAPDASWRTPAAERIELHRKANATVRVVNPYGQPVTGAEVHARLTRHAFGFGSAIAAWALFNAGNDGERYREIAGQWFSRVVLENDLKWPNWEADRARAVDAVQWLRQRGVEVRGHNLIWPGWSFMPADVQQLANNPPALRTRINNHLADIVGTLQRRIVEWDVINEPWRSELVPTSPRRRPLCSALPQ
jgi:GH35 family endo-1,4-beta-xylanase